MIGYRDIAKVLRELDTESQSVPIAAILTNLGITVSGVMEAARQRALRMVMMERGIPFPSAIDGKKYEVPVKDSELVDYTATWLDGFITGMRVFGGFEVHVPDDTHRTSREKK